MASTANLRTRWAAIGAACAVTLGGGTFGIVQASVSSGDRAIYVPISPVRVLDTRSDVGVATIQDATPALLTVTGNIATTDGQQNVVPTGASSVVINVTAINPTSDGFVSLRPGNATEAPSVSTLNVTVGGTFPNGATITLPTTGGSAGQIQIWYEAYAATGGTTDLLIDVVGYYADHNHDDRYYTETEVDTALADKASASDLTSGLAGKADASDLTSGLASKANTSDLESGLAGKADVNSLFPPFVPSLPITVDSEGNAGQFNSIAIGTNGNPIISYLDGSNSALAVAACNDLNCSTSTKNIIDSEGQVGFYSSITIGANGNPVISYYDLSNSALKVAACDNPTCTTSTNSTLDSANDVGWYTTIAIGVNGYPIIGYYDNTNKDLKVAACENPTCTMSTTNTIDSANEVGQGPSIAIGVNGNPIISYYDNTTWNLKVAACKNPTCSGATESDRSTNSVVDSDGSVGQGSSIAIGVNGNPIISYTSATNFDLKVAACKNPTCSGATEIDRSTNSVVDSDGSVGQGSSIAIGVNGNPIISYTSATNFDLKVVVCKNSTCSGAIESDRSINTIIDSDGSIIGNTSITIGTNGNPIISYSDSTTWNLKVAACKNSTCSGATESDRSTNNNLDSIGRFAGYDSIAIGANGNPIISYYDSVNGDLKVVSPWWITGGR